MNAAERARTVLWQTMWREASTAWFRYVGDDGTCRPHATNLSKQQKSRGATARLAMSHALFCPRPRGRLSLDRAGSESTAHKVSDEVGRIRFKQVGEK